MLLVTSSSAGQQTDAWGPASREKQGQPEAPLSAAPGENLEYLPSHLSDRWEGEAQRREGLATDLQQNWTPFLPSRGTVAFAFSIPFEFSYLPQGVN